MNTREMERRLFSNPAIRELLVGFHTDNINRERKAALADPKAHRLTTVMTNAAYRFWDGGTNGKGQTVRFCYSSHRNVAGYFLGWREVIRKNGEGKRDMWCARKTRAAVTDIARNRYNAFIAKAAP